MLKWQKFQVAKINVANLPVTGPIAKLFLANFSGCRVINQVRSFPLFGFPSDDLAIFLATWIPPSHKLHKIKLNFLN